MLLNGIMMFTNLIPYIGRKNIANSTDNLEFDNSIKIVDLKKKTQ